MERSVASDMMPKRDHERDLELDKKIEALRRKNEALMKRYKEVEEDKKRAEEEGMALQSRKGKADDLTITINKSTNDSRVVVAKQFSSGSSTLKEPQESGPDREGESPVSAGRGSRKQLTVTMTGKKGKRVVSERPERRPGPTDIKSPTDDGQMKHVESAGRGKQPAHMTKRDAEPAAAQEETKQRQRHTDEQHKASEHYQEPENPQANTDLNIPTSKEEQEEYVRWKREREQIDRERVARHKNAKGQWRRVWDLDKTENMFSDKSLPDRDWGALRRGGRNTKKGQQKAGKDSRGHDRRGKTKAAKNVLVMSSNAKGKDRLTGRARRWQTNEDEENPQTSDTTLEEFLEELDALTEADKEYLGDQDSKAKSSPSPDALSAPEEECASAILVSADKFREEDSTQAKSGALSSWGSEKRVRFSEELIQRTPARQNSASTDYRGSLKPSSPKKNKQEVQGAHQSCESGEQEDASSQDKGGGPSAPPPAAQQQASNTELTKKHSNLRTSPTSPPAQKDCASLNACSVQAVELPKCNVSNTNTEEIIDSGLSVLSLESGETHPTHSTSSDKAREHGKIV